MKCGYPTCTGTMEIKNVRKMPQPGQLREELACNVCGSYGASLFGGNLALYLSRLQPIKEKEMKLKLDSRALWQIFDNAKYKFMVRHNTAIDAELYALTCYLEALSDYLGTKGVSITFELPQKDYIEPIEDFESYQDVAPKPDDEPK